MAAVDFTRTGRKQLRACAGARINNPFTQVVIKNQKYISCFGLRARTYDYARFLA
jgi:hypothetical protein